jgi:hypothetical protein
VEIHLQNMLPQQPVHVYTFYLPHMEYEGCIGFVMGKMKKIIVNFHVLELFLAKKYDLSD